MGVDAKLYISKTQFTDSRAMFRFFEQLIKEIFGEQVVTKEIANDTDGDYWMMYWSDNISNRQLNIFTNSSVGGFPAVSLSLGAGDNSDKLLNHIGRKMGGIFTGNDCGNNYKVFQDPMEGNEEWLLKQIKAGINVGKYTESLVAYLQNK